MFINLAALVSDTYFTSIYGFEFGNTYLIIKLLIVVLIMIIDLVVSCLSMSTFRSKNRIMHAIALYQLVWFVHRLATEAIISVIILILL